MLAACYALPGSIFRALGGWMSDKLGARKVMYITFISCLTCLFLMSYPATDYTVHGIEGPINFTIATSLVPFVILTIILGFFMSLGKAAVYKHIPVYYPDHVGSVGGLVGMIGGLGGFILPICFGLMNDLIGVWTSCFMLLFAIVAVSLTWMHFSIILTDRKLHPDLRGPHVLPEILPLTNDDDANYP
jgi:NNP family nitrate/nitrite transporter-like MFS transporter